LDGEFWELYFANVPSPNQMENYVINASKDMGREILFLLTNLC